MAWFRRRGEVAQLREEIAGLERRAIGGVPWLPDNSPSVPFGSGGPAHPSRTAYGVDGALSLAAVYSAVNLIASGVASLPITTYLPDEQDGAPQRYTGPTLFTGAGPGSTGNLNEWLFAGVSSLLLQGNAYGYIAARDGYGFPRIIDWLPAADVEIQEEVTAGVYNPLRAEYFYCGRNIPRADLFHVRAFVVPGRTAGISPLRAFADLVMQGRAIQEYGRSWFAAGGAPIGIFRNEMQEVESDQAGEVKTRLMQAMQRRQPLVIGSDWQYQSISVSPEESQFILSSQMTATQIAAIYGVPAHKVGGAEGSGTMRYQNVESESIGFIQDTLRPWLVRLESAFAPIMPGNRYARFDPSAMIRLDAKTRSEVAQIDRAAGLRSPDEIRREWDLAPLPHGAGRVAIPETVVANLARAGIAVPTGYVSDLTMLDVPPGATADEPAEDATPAPPTPITLARNLRGHQAVTRLKDAGPAR